MEMLAVQLLAGQVAREGSGGLAAVTETDVEKAINVVSHVMIKMNTILGETK